MVDVQPQKIRTIGTYKFTFTVEKTVEVHQYVKMVFPPGTTLTPPLPKDEKERKDRLWKMLDYIYFGTTPCGPCGSLPIFTTLDDGSLEIKLNTVVQYDINKDSKVILTIYPQVGITNPPKPGKYTYKISTQPERDLVESAPYEFFESKLSDIKVSATPNGFYQPARYAISFKLGDAGKLKAGSDLINLMFPEGSEFSQLPSTFRYEWIQINGTYLGTKLKDTKNELNIPIPKDLDNGSSVEIIIDAKAGILNPKKPGLYQLGISTTIDDPQKSPPYDIVRTSPQLILSSNKANRNASYAIQYIQDFKLREGERITITFPSSVQLPQTKINKEVLVNGVEVSAIDSKDNVLTLTIEQSLSVGEPVFIVFTKDFGIKNPLKEEMIKVIFKLEGYKDSLTTSSVQILHQFLEISHIYIDDAHSFETTDYVVGIIFDEDNSPSPDDKFTLDLGSPDNVFYDVQIVEPFSVIELFGVKNPSAGTYTAIFSFGSQTASFDYIILPGKPESHAEFTGGLRGKNDWWIEPPTVTIESSDPEAQIFYYLVLDKERQNTIITPYSSPIKLYLGQYKTRLHFYSKNGYGAENEKILDIKVDTMGPEMEIRNPKYTSVSTKESTIKIEGRSDPIEMNLYGLEQLVYDPVTINHKLVTLSPLDGTFSKEIELAEGENTILVRAEDEAGNFVEKTLVVTRDSSPPELTILSPLPEQTFTKNPVSISGKTEPSAKLTINGNPVKIEEDGTFRFEVSLVNIGPSLIYFVVTDSLGNITKKEIQVWRGYTILLTIGQTSATVNGVHKVVPLAPYIQQGRTLVPFRFIGEELKAMITFTTDPKTKLVKTVSYELEGTKILLTIGGTIALVNGVEVKLEVPAQIVKGSTVVPLRFVTEGLGCRLNWDPITQNITIWYPKWNI